MKSKILVLDVMTSIDFESIENTGVKAAVKTAPTTDDIQSVHAIQGIPLLTTDNPRAPSQTSAHERLPDIPHSTTVHCVFIVSIARGLSGTQLQSSHASFLIICTRFFVISDGLVDLSLATVAL
jgi:hypothetical protein